MSVSWYAKLDASFHSNRKARKAGRLGRELFVFVLCTNAQRGSLGWIPASDLEPWYLADQLQMTESEATTCVTAAVTAGLIALSGDRVLICGWTEGYAKQPKTRAEIQRDYRERHGKSDGDEVTSYGESNALPRKEGRKEGRERVTAPLSPGSVSERSESENEAGAARDAARGAAQRSGQKHLPADWQPTHAAVATAHSLGLDPAHELAQFRLDAKAKGKTFADPDAAFEKFCRGSRDAGKPTAKPKPGATTQQQRPNRIPLENGNVLEEYPDGRERLLAPDGTVLREGQAESYVRKGATTHSNGRAGGSK